MLNASDAYREAITGSRRTIFIRVVADISDPDKVWLPVTSSGAAPWSQGDQLHDKLFSAPPRYATLERGRWLLGGGFCLLPDDYQAPEHMGFAGSALSGPDGTFSAPPWVQLNFSNVSILQACAVFFSTDPLDGYPADFTVEIMQGGTAYFTRTVADNTAASVSFDGFTVYDPDCIRVTVSRWSLPGRRIRLTELLPGLYEDWDADMLETFRVTQQGQFSCLSMPYGTAEIAMDNSSRRFDPRRKDGIFQSIEERQGVELYLGVGVPSGAEYQQLGIFYQAGDGWRSSRNQMAMKWSLVDIIGLLANRTFLPPDPLPQTLGGWLEAAVSQLGYGFRRRWRADPLYKDAPVTALNREAVTGKTCGDIVRWACMASGTWPRAAGNGRLTADPLWSQGNRLDLDNLEDYPEMSANESLAALIFRLSDGTEYVVSGNATSSEKTLTVINPFLHTPAQALTAARLILSQYGGNIIETAGRGDPSSEIGDVDTVWLDESNAAVGRRIMQTFQIQDHALRGCQSRLLQADGSYLWQSRAVITRSGQWRAPAGVTRLRYIIGQGGQGGGLGQDGSLSHDSSTGSVSASYGADGVGGSGGKIAAGTMDVNPQQLFEVYIGQGGAPSAVYGAAGAEGEETVFGAYSSAAGRAYPLGYTDIASGDSFGRAGVPSPLEGSGDGGAGGRGGTPGSGYFTEYKTELGNTKRTFHQTSPPGPGQPGVRGGSGFVVLYWDKEETHG